MNKRCSKLYKTYCFGLFKIFSSHVFLITNAFCTLEDFNKIDVVRTCQACEFKDVLSLDRETLVELLIRFPNAFSENLRSYLSTWTR